MERRVSDLEVRAAVQENKGKVSENRITDLEIEVKYHSRMLFKMQGVTAFLVVVVPVLVEYLK
jgi:uncharacterized coiled-coil protein SlyX|tara:strand:+ start:509 stop:697 length:189 start_codon:yes stop_codon:yes gene_type:complete